MSMLFFRLSKDVESLLYKIDKLKNTDMTVEEFNNSTPEFGGWFDDQSIILADDDIYIGFPSFSRQWNTILGMNMSSTLLEFRGELRELSRRLEEELKDHLFFHVTYGRHYYESAMLFGAEVNDKFSNAIDDIEEAGKCIAVGRGTGAVMHLMRVMEVGLKALAKMLDIPYAPSWESYLTQIAAKINEKHNLKDEAWKKDEPFFRDISGDLVVIKTAFRNPSMHVVRKYSAEEAEEIFRAIKILMQRLASR